MRRKKDRLETVLWNLIQSISVGAELLASFMPSTSKKILEQLGGGHVTDKPEILFQRLDVEEVMKKVEELHPHTEEVSGENKEEEPVIDIEAKPEITFDQFGAMQFQVGEIIACEEVKKSKKLLCSQVKIGSQVKQIVSGIKAHYTPEEMVGKKVMVLVNLKPAKLAGVLSEGMLLCAEDDKGNLALVVPKKICRQAPRSADAGDSGTRSARISERPVWNGERINYNRGGSQINSDCLPGLCLPLFQDGFQHVVYFFHRHNGQFFFYFLCHVFQILHIIVRDKYPLNACALAAISFSGRPPIGITPPRRETSPVMALSGSAGLPVIREARAVTRVMPAEGPSFGTAPAGT